MLSLKEHPEGIVFKIFVQARSSKNTIAGIHGDALKIRLTAPPVDDAANKMCVKFLAKCLDVSKSSLEIISGHTGRNKQILLRCEGDGDTETERTRLSGLIASLISS